jgi:hypothetical protein
MQPDCAERDAAWDPCLRRRGDRVRGVLRWGGKLLISDLGVRDAELLWRELHRPGNL